MYLNNHEYNLQDFLQSINFIPPQGFQVAYFITPHDIGQLPQNSGYEVIPTPEDESQTYTMTPPITKIDQAETPADYSSFDIPELGRRIPTPNILPEITEPEDLKSPFVKVLSESSIYGTDIQLKEDWMMFPKNTIFHCITKKLNEGLPKDNLLMRAAGWNPDIDEFEGKFNYSIKNSNLDKIITRYYCNNLLSPEEIVKKLLSDKYYGKKFANRESDLLKYVKNATLDLSYDIKDCIDYIKEYSTVDAKRKYPGFIVDISLRKMGKEYENYGATKWYHEGFKDTQPIKESTMTDEGWSEELTYSVLKRKIYKMLEIGFEISEIQQSLLIDYDLDINNPEDSDVLDMIDDIIDEYIANE